MIRNVVILIAMAIGASSFVVAQPLPYNQTQLSAGSEPMRAGKFEPNWESLRQYEAPEWFRDAKFGIWAHWGPQCQPEQGDWYARYLYVQGDKRYEWHMEKYGHPSKMGFKDVIHEWKAEKWDPRKLVALYKRAGAKYFFAMANHHDNLDLWDSRHQPWNSVAVGPRRNIIGEWEEAAREEGLRFGVSVHSSHAWLWYETAQSADKEGPLAGVPYDGKLTKADGAGQWWEGLDPQDLYAQNHTPSPDFENPKSIYARWRWGNGASIPDDAYCEDFYNRTMDLINRYQPDLIYYDDTVLPLYPISDVGLKLLAHYYNANIQWHNGRNEAVVFGKILDEQQRQALVWDIEKGQSDRIEPLPWQACTCLGMWHYDRGIYHRREYKSAGTVVRMLADIVSKNGNLLLSVPMRGDGTIDELELEILQGITTWMDVNGEAIFGTRPWKVFGEGPASDDAPPLSAEGFNEGKGIPFSAKDVRFTAKGDVLYAIVLGCPAEPLHIKFLGNDAGLLERPISGVELLGSEQAIQWSRTAEALVIEPLKKYPTEHAIAFKIISSQ